MVLVVYRQLQFAHAYHIRYCRMDDVEALSEGNKSADRIQDKALDEKRGHLEVCQ